ncbi:hypothetical protein KC711_02800 [Candidatus Peregrinibacteria bacterium]|nr:hypothetical protein [Candidatus Peregrinibacteria bacterium]
MFKLPFLVPTDPIYIARSAEYSDPFAEYAIPEMILKLRQGIGRLIRSPQDTGVIIIFDDRLVTTSWGARLADALPT